MLNIQEDTGIDAAFARQLDLSCVGRERGESVRPPALDNAYVVKYNRYGESRQPGISNAMCSFFGVSSSRKKDGNVFLVAFYECEDGFQLESDDTDRLYCSMDAWIGERPRCVGDGATDDYNDEDDADEDDGGDDDDDGNEHDDGGDENNETGGQTTKDDGMFGGTMAAPHWND